MDNRPNYGTLENLTLTEQEFEALRPTRAGGTYRRAFCCFHGSDRQRSLSLNTNTGRFHCWQCGAWGFLEEARERYARDHQAQRPSGDGYGAPWRAGRRATIPPRHTPPLRTEQPPEPLSPDRLEQLRAFQEALPGGPGAVYLAGRGIPLVLAQRLGLGYAAPGSWPGRAPQFDRLVIPHTDPDGRVVNLYGRAIDTSGAVPKGLRHDHLPGPKGYFNAPALAAPGETLYICEGAFDALALLAAGCERAVAIFGAEGWRWPWARELGHLTLALDNDDMGQRKTHDLKQQAWMRGKQVAILPPSAYGGEKDVAAAWAARRLALEEEAGVAASASPDDRGPQRGDAEHPGAWLAEQPPTAKRVAYLRAHGFCGAIPSRGEATALIDAHRQAQPSDADHIPDPRPDLAADSPRWTHLLTLAFDHDGDDPAGVFGALFALRQAFGAALVVEQGRGRLAAGGMSDAVFDHLRETYLAPHEMALAALLHAVADAEQVPAA